MKRKFSFFLSLAVAGGMFLPIQAMSQGTHNDSLRVEPATVAVQTGSVGQTLRISVGKTLFFDSPAALSRVYVDSPAIIQAYTASPHQVIVSGIAPGMATLVLWDQHGANTAYSIAVDVNIEHLREALASRFPFDRIDATADQDEIVLTGFVSSEAEYKAAGNLAATFGKSIANSLRIAAPHLQQVRLDVKFFEVDRTKLAQAGFNLLSLGKTLGMTSTGQYQAFQMPTINSPQSSVSETTNNPLNLLLFNSDLNLGAAIQDLEQRQILQILAEPTITALSGHSARFLDGGEFPFPMVEGGVSGQVAISVQFMPYGVSLTFLPVVLDDGTIRLHVVPEVSALDYTNEVQISGYSIPAIDTRRAETDIELRDGQTFALTGLLDHRLTDEFEHMPVISSIPILGMLFRSKSVQQTTTDLMVMVTPHIVNTLNGPEATQPTPPGPVKPYLDKKSFDKAVNGRK